MAAPDKKEELRKLLVELMTTVRDLKKRVEELERWKRERILRSVPGLDD